MAHSRWIREIIWIAAAVDGTVAAAFLSPRVLAQMLDLPHAPDSAETRTALALASVLMAGWTTLLLWAGRQPTQRRGVLLLTVVPVIAGLSLAVLFGWWSDYTPTTSALSIWLGQAVLGMLLLWAYGAAGRSD